MVKQEKTFTKKVDEHNAECRFRLPDCPENYPVLVKIVAHPHFQSLKLSNKRRT